MTRSGTADHDAGGAIRPSPRLQAVLLWTGPVACVLGLVATRMDAHWAPGRLLELLVVAAAHVALAWPVRRFARVSMATALLVPIVAGLALFAGVLPLLGALLLALAAVAIGGALSPGAPVALRAAAGLALVAGVVGWLLPLPVHQRWLHVAACLLVIVLARRALADAARRMSAGWRDAVAASPRTATLAVLAMALAATGCWLPTLQFDDLAYHLSMPWQLMETGRYALDPTHQAWALAPWASDVLHAVAQVLAGSEARGPLNAAWLAITATGLWYLVRALDGPAALAWTVVALYASLPMTAALAAGMQTETATAALVAWLAWLIARPADAAVARPLRTGATLVGGLFALKLVAAVQATAMVAWAAIARRPWSRPAHLWPAVLLAVAVGGSSYAYAQWVSGNPVLPLFNRWFGSSYFRAVDLVDPRWNAGLSPLLPWSLTFDTGRFWEQFPGSAGFGLVALAGAWLLALADRALRPLAGMATVLLVIPLLPLQYVRYAFPAMVLLLVPTAVAAVRADPRRGPWLLVALAVANFAFQANANWMQRNGALKETILAAGADDGLYAEYAPERLLAAGIRESGDPRAAMFLNGDVPRHAELGARGRTSSWYAPRIQRQATRADRDPTGAAWVALWRRETVGHVVVDASAPPARVAALARARATLRGETGGAQWWQLPPGDAR